MTQLKGTINSSLGKCWAWKNWRWKGARKTNLLSFLLPENQSEVHCFFLAFPRSLMCSMDAPSFSVYPSQMVRGGSWWAMHHIASLHISLHSGRLFEKMVLMSPLLLLPMYFCNVTLTIFPWGGRVPAFWVWGGHVTCVDQQRVILCLTWRPCSFCSFGTMPSKDDYVKKSLWTKICDKRSLAIPEVLDKHNESPNMWTILS